MAVTSSQSKAPASVNNVAVGRYLDDAASPAAATITPGFVSRYFIWLNLTDRIGYEWFEGMTAGQTLKTVAAGTRTLDTADAAITENGTGTVTIAAAAILQNKQYSWRAIG